MTSSKSIGRKVIRTCIKNWQPDFGVFYKTTIPVNRTFSSRFVVVKHCDSNVLLKERFKTFLKRIKITSKRWNFDTASVCNRSLEFRVGIDPEFHLASIILKPLYIVPKSRKLCKFVRKFILVRFTVSLISWTSCYYRDYWYKS